MEASFQECSRPSSAQVLRKDRKLEFPLRYRHTRQARPVYEHGGVSITGKTASPNVHRNENTVQPMAHVIPLNRTTMFKLFAAIVESRTCSRNSSPKMAARSRSNGNASRGAGSPAQGQHANGRLRTEVQDCRQSNADRQEL